MNARSYVYSRWLVALVPALLLIFTGCAAQPKRVIIEVDGARRTLHTEADTVRDVLAEARITLGELDKVTPDLYARLKPETVIKVSRVERRLETTQLSVPFTRHVVTNEAIPAGETRLIQLGANGIDEITYQVTLEDGVEVERIEIARVPLQEPIDEMLVVGAQAALPSIPFEGTIAYLSAGNAWVIREQTGNRRPLTTDGNLDGRVFALAPNGKELLYTRLAERNSEGTLNTLWVQNTVILNDPPTSLPITNVLWADWSPDGSTIAYSTADRTPGPPGWRARNDLWLMPLDPEEPSPTRVIPPSTTGVYSWWGGSCAWSPDSRYIAYARADQIGIIDVQAGTVTNLFNFPPLRTYSEWIWVPSLSWSPAGDFLAAVIHGSPGASGEAPEDSDAFDLWLISADGLWQAKVKANVGMWSNPAWGRHSVLYGVALNPERSADSRYVLYVMDVDGSNAYQIFPEPGEMGVELPQVAWSPDGRALLFVYNSNLYLAMLSSGQVRQLTSAGDVSLPRWVGTASQGVPDDALPQTPEPITPSAPRPIEAAREALTP